MKKSILFLAAIIGLLCFASCQKPVGDDPDVTFVSGDTTGLFRWGITPNVDFADVAIEAVLNDTTKSIQVFSMKFYYRLKPVNDTIVGDKWSVKPVIETVEVIETGWTAAVQLEGLLPDTTYVCYMEIEDFFGTTKGQEREFATLGTSGGKLVVNADSVRTDAENNLLFYGSLRSHYRAFDSEGLEMKVRYGTTLNPDSVPVLDQESGNYTIDTMLNRVNDTVTCVFHCKMSYIDSCWYALTVVDHWGNDYHSDTLQFSNAPAIAVWTKNPTVDGSTMATLKGKCEYHGAQNTTIKERGFCYREGPGVPTIMDSVWKDTGTLEWNVAFEHQLTGLKPNTTYSCRVYFKIGNVGVTYSDEVKTFTTEPEVELLFADPDSIQSTSMYLKATIRETERQIDSCRFLWREANSDNDQGILTLQNMTGSLYCDLNEVDRTFAATVGELKPNQRYVLGAYIRLKNGEISFSDTKFATTKE